MQPTKPARKFRERKPKPTNISNQKSVQLPPASVALLRVDASASTVSAGIHVNNLFLREAIQVFVCRSGVKIIQVRVVFVEQRIESIAAERSWQVAATIGADSIGRRIPLVLR